MKVNPPTPTAGICLPAAHEALEALAFAAYAAELDAAGICADAIAAAMSAAAHAFPEGSTAETAFAALASLIGLAVAS